MPSYQHVITGAKCQDPQNTWGGIIADDMGLGKSLTMLSAIASSTALASDYARSETCRTRNYDDPVIAARSTLIVVPSTRQSFFTPERCLCWISDIFATVLIDNWIDEIHKLSEVNSFQDSDC